MPELEHKDERTGWKLAAVLSATMSIGLMGYSALATFEFTGVNGVLRTVLVPPLPGQGPFFLFPLLATVPLAGAIALRRSALVLATLVLSSVVGVAPHAKFLLYGSDGLHDYMAGAFVSTSAWAVGWVGYLCVASALVIGLRR